MGKGPLEGSLQPKTTQDHQWYYIYMYHHDGFFWGVATGHKSAHEKGTRPNVHLNISVPIMR
jgi:hypothetical protein